jgi:predicted transposase YdaD
LKYELDRRETIAEARDEGREEGIKIGEAKGEARGIGIGEARGAEKEQKKSHEKILQTARNLKRMGLSDEQIASALELSAGDLKNLES